MATSSSVAAPGRDRRAVVEGVGAGAVLRHGRQQLAARPHRRRSAGRDRLDLETGALGELRRRAPGSRRARAARVRQEAGEAQRAEAGDRRGESRGRLGIGDARAAEAGVALDEHAQLAPGARGRPVEARSSRGVVGHDRHARPLEQRRQVRELPLAKHVGRDEQVVHAPRRPSSRPHPGSGTSGRRRRARAGAGRSPCTCGS